MPEGLFGNLPKFAQNVKVHVAMLRYKNVTKNVQKNKNPNTNCD